MMTAIDLGAYFARVGYTGPAALTLAVLRDLHARHPAAILFEGLAPFLGRPVSIDPGAVQAKLVRGRRGGYCHEQNALFHEVLAAIGFRVTALGGRVVWMTPGRDAPLTHRLTLVDLPEDRFLADVGFGGQTPTAPLRLDPGPEQATPHGTYRVAQDGDAFETQMRVGERWEPMYRFTLAPQSPADFGMANWFTSTHPRGRFVRNLVAARVVGEARVNLLNASLSVRYPDGGVEHRTLTDALDLGEVLTGVMGLDLPVPVEAIWAKLPGEPISSWP
jgi:N-hydroxyarylamine O-acetyltransferase